MALQINGGANGAVVEGNYIHEPPGGVHEGCGAMQIIGFGDDVPLGCIDCSISGNRLENLASGIVLAGHDGSRVENNLISFAPSPDSPTPCVGIYLFPRLDGVDPPTNQVAVVNNSIYLERDDERCVAVHVTEEGTDHVVANNAVLYRGSDPSFDCFRFESLVSMGAIGHNVCAAPAAAGAMWAEVAGQRHDLESFQSLGAIGAGSLTSAAALVAPFAPAFDLRPASCEQALSGGGDPRHCPTEDFGGASRPSEGGCDVGAFQLSAQ